MSPMDSIPITGLGGVNDEEEAMVGCAYRRFAGICRSDQVPKALIESNCRDLNGRCCVCSWEVYFNRCKVVLTVDCLVASVVLYKTYDELCY